MATPEARKEAEELLAIYRRRLRVRDKQAARLGDSADPIIQLDREELLLNIAMLEPLAEPEPATEAKDLVQRVLTDDLTLLYVQGARTNTRLAQVEQAQHASQEWRMQTTADVQTLKAGFSHEKQARKRGQRLRISAELAIVVLVLLLHAYGWL